MNDKPNNGCMCELCRPNWYLGYSGDFVPEQPEPERPKERQEKKPVVLVAVPVTEPVLATN